MTFARLSDSFESKIQYYALSTSAVYLHVRGLQLCIAVHSDGLISVASARELLQTRNVRNRDAVIAELVASGEWWWINDTHLQIEWRHQETAAQAALKETQNSKRQADYVTRNLLCASGDHSMCEGTKRECQRGKKSVIDDTHSTPHHSTPHRRGGVKNEHESKEKATSAVPALGGRPSSSPRQSQNSATDMDGWLAPDDPLQVALTELMTDVKLNGFGK